MTANNSQKAGLLTKLYKFVIKILKSYRKATEKKTEMRANATVSMV
jgi:hypothetical protein